MSCPMETELTAYVDGELPPRERDALQAHLPGCAECRATEALLRRTLTRLAELPAFEPSPATRRAVLERLEQVTQPWPRRLERALARLWPVPAAGLAATAALVAVLALRPHHAQPRGAELDPGTLELASNLELAENYEVLGLQTAEDVEVVAHLQELEKTP